MGKIKGKMIKWGKDYFTKKRILTNITELLLAIVIVLCICGYLAPIYLYVGVGIFLIVGGIWFVKKCINDIKGGFFNGNNKDSGQ